MNIARAHVCHWCATTVRGLRNVMLCCQTLHPTTNSTLSTFSTSYFLSPVICLLLSLTSLWFFMIFALSACGLYLSLHSQSTSVSVEALPASAQIPNTPAPWQKGFLCTAPILSCSSRWQLRFSELSLYFLSTQPHLLFCKKQTWKCVILMCKQNKYTKHLHISMDCLPA